MPDVTSRSPGWISALGDRKRSSGRRPVPAPNMHAAHAAALDLHRHRVILVGDQRDLRHVREHARDLADDAQLVDHRLPGLDAGALALVDEHLLRERVAAGVQHFGGDRRAAEARLDFRAARAAARSPAATSG